LQLLHPHERNVPKQLFAFNTSERNEQKQLQLLNMLVRNL
jgi:hypothetical protein